MSASLEYHRATDVPEEVPLLMVAIGPRATARS